MITYKIGFAVVFLFAGVIMGKCEVEKLNGEESVLLMEEVCKSARRFEENNGIKADSFAYKWSIENVKATIGDAACVNLLSKNLISGFKVVDEVKFHDGAWFKIIILNKGINTKSKDILVEFRGDRGDIDITYRFDYSGGDLALQMIEIAHLEILRIAE